MSDKTVYTVHHTDYYTATRSFNVIADSPEQAELIAADLAMEVAIPENEFIEILDAANCEGDVIVEEADDQDDELTTIPLEAVEAIEARNSRYNIGSNFHGNTQPPCLLRVAYEQHLREGDSRCEIT